MVTNNIIENLIIFRIFQDRENLCGQKVVNCELIANIEFNWILRRRIKNNNNPRAILRGFSSIYPKKNGQKSVWYLF